jgi:hypothetical protein
MKLPAGCGGQRQRAESLRIVEETLDLSACSRAAHEVTLETCSQET